MGGLIAVAALLVVTARASADGGNAPPAQHKPSALAVELKSATAINRGGAAGLIRAAGQITSVELVDITTHARQATLTAPERQQLSAVVRGGAVSGSSSSTGSPWDSVYLIRTRSLGLYVAQLWDDQVLIVEVPDQLTKPDPPGRFTVIRKRSEITLSYEAFVALRKVLEQKLGAPTKKEFRPFDIRDIPVPSEAKREPG